MKISYILFHNKNTLEIRKAYLSERGSVLDICRSPEYVYGKDRSEAYDKAHSLVESSAYSDVYNKEHYPTVDPENLWGLLLEYKQDRKKSYADLKHACIFILKGFGYTRNFISLFFGVTEPAIAYTVRTVPVKMYSDDNFISMINSFPERIQAFMFRIKDDYLNAERTKTEINK